MEDVDNDYEDVEGIEEVVYVCGKTYKDTDTKFTVEEGVELQIIGK